MKKSLIRTNEVATNLEPVGINKLIMDVEQLKSVVRGYCCMAAVTAQLTSEEGFQIFQELDSLVEEYTIQDAVNIDQLFRGENSAFERQIRAKLAKAEYSDVVQ